jgi:hypothetical protein
MPAPTPTRNRNVYFVGAGLSAALGLPNTPSLIEGVLELAAHHNRWLISEHLPDRLTAAFKYFYPDAVNTGYRPDVVDFFSTLRTYLDVGAGLAGGFHDAPELYRSLKFAIAHLLIERIRDCNPHLEAGHAYLDEVVQPGNIVITSNWDIVVERYAQLKGVPLRLSGYGENELVVLKLHGSVDWCRGSDRASYPDDDYCLLGQQLFGVRPYEMTLPSAKDLGDRLVRIRALENWGDAWRKITSRGNDLHMVTMARGKAGDLGPLLPVWRDAYGAISRASRLEIVGYSLPDDDIEIRTLLRGGIRRGSGPSQLTIRNPAPEVHERARRYLRHRLVTNYTPVNSI